MGREYSRRGPLCIQRRHTCRAGAARMGAGLRQPGAAVARVRARVAQGGHDASETVIRRRFDAGLRNFNERYKTLANSWVLYDNSGAGPILMETGGER